MTAIRSKILLAALFAIVVSGFSWAPTLHRGKCIGGVFCPFIWQPVCAIDPFWKQKRTYPNLCVAEHDNAVWVHNGPCP